MTVDKYSICFYTHLNQMHVGKVPVTFLPFSGLEISSIEMVLLSSGLEVVTIPG